jgi:hypothetical protein
VALLLLSKLGAEVLRQQRAAAAPKAAAWQEEDTAQM